MMKPPAASPSGPARYNIEVWLQLSWDVKVEVVEAKRRIPAISISRSSSSLFNLKLLIFLARAAAATIHSRPPNHHAGLPQTSGRPFDRQNAP